MPNEGPLTSAPPIGGMGAAHVDASVERVLAATRLPSAKRIFTIGPFGRRVSFASQQQRAYNTIWALLHAGDITAKTNSRLGDHVAVIGGGLAGISAAAALLSSGVQVTLFEKAPAVLTLQQGTHHRLAHPTINFWPRSQLASTTEFPFFDWYFAPCAVVIASIRREWDRYFTGRLSNYYLNTTVIRIEPANSAFEKRVKVHSSGPHHGKAAGSKTDPEEFDAAIVATGFGEETSVAQSNTGKYWDPDDVELARDRPANRQFVVSGTGDGGLIDALRLTHKGFDCGRLALRLVSTLDSSIAGAIKELENDANNSGAERSSDILADGYRRLVFGLDRQRLSTLESSLCNIGKVQLVGKDPTPFSPLSAPIHKLLIAHAIERGAISYLRAKIVTVKGRLTARHLPDKTETRLKSDYYIARHGAVPPIASIIEGVDIQELKARQLLVSDELAVAGYDPKVFFANSDQYPMRDVSSPDFARHRYPIAKDFVYSTYDRAGLRLAASDEGVPEFNIQKDDLSVALTNDCGYEDKSLFGIPVRSKPIPVANLHSGPTHAWLENGLLRSGARIGSVDADHFTGTLGLILKKDGLADAYALSVSHVVRDDLVTSMSSHGKRLVGTVARSPSRLNGSRSIDAMVSWFRISPSVPVDSRIYWQPNVRSFLAPADSFGLNVRKLGAASGLTEGVISAIGATVRIPDWETGELRTCQNVIEVETSGDGSASFSIPGDSGALVVSEDGRIVGLVVGGYGRYTIVAPLSELVARERFQLFDAPLPDTRTPEYLVSSSMPSASLEIIAACRSSPSNWVNYVSRARKALSRHFTHIRRNKGLAAMEAEQNSIARQLYQIVGIEQFARSAGMMSIINDAPGAIPSDNWLWRALIERLELIEVHALSGAIRNREPPSPWHKIDTMASVSLWTEEQWFSHSVDLHPPQAADLAASALADMCLGRNSLDAEDIAQ
jgi:Pyridine nucleotide-disulphide oxidoreductase